jgi:hypothetical protein
LPPIDDRSGHRPDHRQRDGSRDRNGTAFAKGRDFAFYPRERTFRLCCFKVSPFHAATVLVLVRFEGFTLSVLKFIACCG